MILPFNPKAGLIVLPTRLFGPSGDLIMRMALDTGATGSTVSADMLIGAGYDLSQSAPTLQITTGSTVEMVPQLPITRIEALNIGRESFSVGVLTLPPTAGVDGVLGLDFFRGHRLLIDLKMGLVTVD